jgi:hypothetical protein
MWSTPDKIFGITDNKDWLIGLEKIDRLRFKTKKEYINLGGLECYRTEYVDHMNKLGYEEVFISNQQDDEGEMGKLLVFKREDLYFIICPNYNLDGDLDIYIIKEKKRGLTL